MSQFALGQWKGKGKCVHFPALIWFFVHYHKDGMIEMFWFDVACDQVKLVCAEVSRQITEVGKDFCYS